MCELLGLSSREPTTVTLSLERLATHTSKGFPNRDGWGIAYAQGRDARLLKEAEAASESDLVRFIEHHDMRSKLIISHIRHASQGNLGYAQTHPFLRELGGAAHVFAHNGDLGPPADLESLHLGRFRPVGGTDSEHAFCALLARLEALWLDSPGVPPLDERRRIVERFASELVELGIANFLYSDGQALFAHSHVRRPDPTSEPVDPGLHLLCCGREAHPMLAPGVEFRSNADEPRAVLLASVPLDDSCWRPLHRGELLVITEGVVRE